MKQFKKFFYYLLVVTLVWSFQSCSDDDDDDEYAEWRQKNEAKISEIANDPDYKKTDKIIGAPSVYYKPLNENEVDPEAPSPMLNDKIKVKYIGKYYNGTVFDSSIINPYEITLSESTYITGWIIALQHMKVGEKWDIWIPWILGYGSNPSSLISIPPYSTLNFEIELLEIVERAAG